VIGMLSSVVSVFFYLRVVVMMYMAEPGRFGAADRRLVPCRSWRSSSPRLRSSILESCQRE
jgi:NADH:ubiquinone oxidoreductase subunit 2 (subunit N)